MLPKIGERESAGGGRGVVGEGIAGCDVPDGGVAAGGSDDSGGGRSDPPGDGDRGVAEVMLPSRPGGGGDGPGEAVLIVETATLVGGRIVWWGPQ